MLGALFGVGYALLLPPLQAPDEFAHFYRAYGIAEGSCVASKVTPIPLSIKEMTADFQNNIESQRRIDSSDILVYLHKPLSQDRQEGVWNDAANMYSCVPYFPEVVGIEAGRLFHAPPAAVLYLGRLANLIAYLAIVYLALLQLPGFQVPLLALAMMPMALNQAASSSWDGIAFATAFFLCAYIIRLAWDPAIGTLQPRHYLTLGGVIVVAGMCKTDAWLIPLLSFVPASRFGGSRRKWAMLAGAVLLAVAVIAGWNYVNRQDIAGWVDHIKEYRQIYLSENVDALTRHPVILLQAFFRTGWTYAGDFAAQFVGRLGWLAVILPSWSIALYLLLLPFAALTEASEIRMKPSYRVACLGVVVIALLSVFIGMWCAETARNHREAVLRGNGYIAGVQGRYFIPFAFPLLLAMANSKLRINRRWLVAIAAVTIVTVNAVALQKIRSTYYVGVGVGPYENKLVKRAGSTAEDGKVFLVRGTARHWIIFGTWVDKHGYRWGDLKILTPEQFNAIPEGKPITEQ